LDDKGTIWTLQQFTTVAGKPWYALQQHTDAGVERQYTGYRHEMDALCRELRIVPEALPPTTEEEFLRRWANELPDKRPLRSSTGRLR
jgi:hypothetical protein